MDLLAVAAGCHQAFAAQHGQLLRQGRLLDAEQRLQLADVALALGQLAQQQQAPQEQTAAIQGLIEYLKAKAAGG